MRKKIYSVFVLVTFFGSLIWFPDQADAFCTLQAANGRPLVWDCDRGVILRYQTTKFFIAAAKSGEGFASYDGGILLHYYQGAACETTPLIISYTKSPWGYFVEYAQYFDGKTFYVASQKDPAIAPSTIQSWNDLHDPTCYPFAGGLDGDYVFTAVARKEIPGNFPLPWKVVVPNP